MIRDAYAYPLANESELNVISFRTGVQARLLANWWRLTGRRFDVLGVMRGFGKRTLSLIREIPARRVIVHDQRLSAEATEIVHGDPIDTDNDPHYGPAWRIVRALNMEFPAPDRLHFPRLAARWQTRDKRFIVVCPLSDERRRNIPASAIESLYAHLRERHPDHQVLVLVRRKGDLQALTRIPKIPIREFLNMPRLVDLLLQSSHFYGTDTGLLHLAIAMGMPCTAFFGPTQPHRVLPVEQADISAWRAPILGDRHCDLKVCDNAVCIARAVSMMVDGEDTASEPTRSGCPLG
ncbi:MAG: hypothetical protein KJ634_10405 [Gammaproteobacteria bacterium]|nr:hypothetical protein [Gammaproteobacteria bacterium]MBU1416023.1 hypothetical protein [Gammaproteobacteria bacterium]